jgi:hypothetical protein
MKTYEPWSSQALGLGLVAALSVRNYYTSAGPPGPYSFGSSEESSPAFVIEVEGGVVCSIGCAVSASLGVMYLRTGRLFKFMGFEQGFPLHANGLVASGIAIMGSVQMEL